MKWSAKRVAENASHSMPMLGGIAHPGPKLLQHEKLAIREPLLRREEPTFVLKCAMYLEKRPRLKGQDYSCHTVEDCRSVPADVVPCAQRSN